MTEERLVQIEAEYRRRYGQAYKELHEAIHQIHKLHRVKNAAQRLLDGLFEKKAEGPILDRRSDLRTALEALKEKP